MPETAYIIVPEDRDDTSTNIVLLQSIPIDRESGDILEAMGVLQYNLSVSDVSGNLVHRVVFHILMFCRVVFLVVEKFLLTVL